MSALTPEATEALRKRLTLAKRREDVEILGVIGVRPEWVQDWLSHVPGLVFDVEFTYTSGRRQRRRERVAFKALDNGDKLSTILIPPALLQFLTEAVRLGGELPPPDRIPPGRITHLETCGGGSR